MRQRTMDEMITYFNQQVSKMDIDRQYKMALLGMITAIGYENKKQEQKWIPCSERLPEVGQSVLLSVGGMYTAEGCLRDDGDWAQFRWTATLRKDMVGAWRPLPEPYKGDRNETD